MPSFSIHRRCAGLCVLAVAFGTLSLAAVAQTRNGGDTQALSAVMDRLLIDVPMSIAATEPVRTPLEELSREPCDQKAIEELGTALEKVGRRREAANAHVGFSAACGNYAPSLRTAVNILLTLSDYPNAVLIATKLIALEPFSDNGYYLRAVAYDRGGQFKQAIDDYVTAIELFGNKDNISSVSYLAMARAYEKLGQFCDAIEPIESWVSLNPARNDTSQTRAIIADYTAKGRCQDTRGTGEEVFRISRQSNVVRLSVTINGVQGNMVLDTGATFVSLTGAFAQKAKVQIDQDSVVHIRTANGVVEGKRGRAAKIQLRSLQAKDVPVVVDTSPKASYGEGIDGLLGMSFLSHFKFSIDAQALRISGGRAR